MNIKLSKCIAFAKLNTLFFSFNQSQFSLYHNWIVFILVIQCISISNVSYINLRFVFNFLVQNEILVFAMIISCFIYSSIIKYIYISIKEIVFGDPSKISQIKVPLFCLQFPNHLIL